MDFQYRARGHDRADHALVVFSDIEMGGGGPTDDFPGTPWLAALLDTYQRAPWDRVPTTFVFNGDSFDFLKVAVNGVYHHLVDEAVALQKARVVIESHPRFFDALHRLLRFQGAPRDVVFTIGNHDYELLFPAVQALIRDACGGAKDNVRFPGFEVRVGDVHIEHGSQWDTLFRIDPDLPFVPWMGRPVLNLPWAAVALIEVAMPLHPLLYACDRARPLAAVLERVPEVRSLLLDRYWQYWTRDWPGAWWAGDPTKRVSWTLFQQVARRLQSADPSIDLDPDWTSSVPASVVISGHVHEPSWNTVDGTRVLETGCLRDEFLLNADGTIGPVLPKVYAEVLLRGGRATSAQLVEVVADPEHTAIMPRELEEVLGPLRALRASLPRTTADQAAQLERER